MPQSPKIEKPVEEIPSGLKVYHFHKVDDLRWSKSEKNASATCPFCGKEKKFVIDKLSSQYQCWVCGDTGNEITFVQKLWAMSYDMTKKKDLEILAADSKFFDVESLVEWHVAKHALTDEWCIPGYNNDNKITGLYRFVNMKNKEGNWKPKLLPTPNLGHHLFGRHLFDEAKQVTYLLEGWRDAIKLYEVLKHSAPAGKPLLQDVNVLSVPGTNSFKLEWASLFAEMHVIIMFDNDYPSINPKTQQEVFTGGRAGVARTASMLKDVALSVQYLSWGGRRGNKGYTTDLPDGHDVRDFLTTNA